MSPSAPQLCGGVGCAECCTWYSTYFCSTYDATDDSPISSGGCAGCDQGTDCYSGSDALGWVCVTNDCSVTCSGEPDAGTSDDAGGGGGGGGSGGGGSGGSGGGGSGGGGSGGDIRLTRKAAWEKLADILRSANRGQ